MDNDKKPATPAEGVHGGAEAGSDQPAGTQANSSPDAEPSESSADEKSRPAARASAKTPVTPSAAEASANTRAEAAPTGDTPAKETPAKTPTAARVAPNTGASKTTSTPTASVNKGVSAGVAAKVPAATAAKSAGGNVVTSLPDDDSALNKMRRRIVWASVAGFLVTSFLMFVRFFLPRAIFEPSNVFRVGFPGDYGIGVDTKWQQLYRIWVVRNTERLFVITAVCTHLGCTPDWKESENKFKCPCHGSGYDSEGINFEGPAPRPMDRAHVELDAEGQIVVNKDRVYKWEKGKESEFDNPGAFIRVG